MTYYCATCEKEYKTKQSLNTHYKSQKHDDMISGVKKNYCFYCKYQARDSDKYKRHCLTKKHLKNEDISISKLKKQKHLYTEEEIEELEDKYLFLEHDGKMNLIAYCKEVEKYAIYKKEYKKHKSMEKKWDKVQFCLDNFCEIMKHNQTDMYFKNMYQEWELISMKQYAIMLLRLCNVSDDINKDTKLYCLYKINNKM